MDMRVETMFKGGLASEAGTEVLVEKDDVNLKLDSLISERGL